MAARLVSGIPIPLSSFSFRGRESSSQVGHLSFLSLLAVVCAVLRLAPAAMQSTHDHMTALPWVSLHSAAPCSVSDAVAHTPQHSCSACISLGRLRCRAPAAGACMNSLSVVSVDCAASTPRQYRCASILAVLQPSSSSPLSGSKGSRAPGGQREGGRFCPFVVVVGCPFFRSTGTTSQSVHEEGEIHSSRTVITLAITDTRHARCPS